jgi:UDP-galactose transporter B1
MHEVQLLVGVGGIYFFYLLYGIAQERLTTTPFGPDNEKFHFVIFLVFLQCIINALFALTGLGVRALRPNSNKKDKVPFSEYAWIALTYVFAMLCSNASLQFVDYPTQVLAKSCKPIPVMLMGALAYGRKYEWRKWLCVILISVGISIFMFKHKGGAVEVNADQLNLIWGYVLLLASLAFDGLTGPAQERLYEKHNPDPPSFISMMLYTNVWAILFMGVTLVLAGEAVDAVLFTIRNPDVWWLIFVFGACSAFGQFFIHYTLQNLGSLVLTITTTTRKFFTILASVLWFGHALSFDKWLGVGLVFAGLGVEILGKYWSTPTPAIKTKKHQ